MEEALRSTEASLAPKDGPSLVQMFADLATQSGVRVVTLSFQEALHPRQKKEREGLPLSTLSVTLQVQGPRDALLDFLNRLRRQVPTLALGPVQFTQVKEELWNLSGQVTFAFLSEEGTDEDQGVKEASP